MGIFQLQKLQKWNVSERTVRNYCAHDKVPEKMKNLLAKYCEHNEKTLDDILNFHHEFENIHPFQDENGRVGRLILFKECLKYDIVPFIIDEDLKRYYYRGFQNGIKKEGI